MIGLAEFKESLGSLTQTMTETEIERLRQIEDHLANLVFEEWLRERNSSVNKSLDNN